MFSRLLSVAFGGSGTGESEFREKEVISLQCFSHSRIYIYVCVQSLSELWMEYLLSKKDREQQQQLDEEDDDIRI